MQQYCNIHLFKGWWKNKIHLIVKDASGKKWVHLKNEDEEAERMKEEIPSSKVL